jgi:hypothetical protein
LETWPKTRLEADGTLTPIVTDGGSGLPGAPDTPVRVAATSLYSELAWIRHAGGSLSVAERRWSSASERLFPPAGSTKTHDLQLAKVEGGPGS